MENKINKTLMQYFEWYLPNHVSLWEKVKNEAQYLSSMGITSIWLPPAYKGSGGMWDTGYGAYDLYDLGEFNQKGSIPTKYGTKEQYLEAIKVLKGNNIDVYADIVFNHRLGADETEDVLAVQIDPNNRNTILTPDPISIKAWTKFTFSGRNNTYSAFQWNWTHFHGVDWDENSKKNGIYKFYGKNWDSTVDKENGNFDYLMGADVDLNNMDVVEELINWGKWYIHLTGIDGFRIDAAKHIRSTFFINWLNRMQEEAGKDLFSVGEYWSNNVSTLKAYLKETESYMNLFDVPLHYHFQEASYSNGNYDMRYILDNTLVKEVPDKAVTFVDNHDTEIGQALSSWVADWFKPLAYSLILLREDGLPCVFYGDYYGIPSQNVNSMKSKIEPLLMTRKYFAYGPQRDYFDNPNIIAWVREGDFSHPDSGVVVIMTDGAGGSKSMNVGRNLANTVLYDCTGNMQETIYVDEDGNGIFYVDGGSVSIWIKQKNRYDI